MGLTLLVSHLSSITLFHWLMSNISLSYLFFLGFFFPVVSGRRVSQDPITSLAIGEYITGLFESLYMQGT